MDMIIFPTRVIDVPDCVAPYHVEPMVTSALFFGGVLLLIAVTFLIYTWLEKRR